MNTVAHKSKLIFSILIIRKGFLRIFPEIISNRLALSVEAALVKAVRFKFLRIVWILVDHRYLI